MNNKIIYGIIILCIVFTILIGASVLSTGYKIADFLLALFLSAIGLYLMYKNIETAKVAPDPNPNSSSGIVDNENLDNENIDKTLLEMQEMLEVKIKFDKYISEFILSLHNMKTLENKIYLEQYKEYKNKINKDLKIPLATEKSDENKKILTNLINNNIYIQTINKYKDLDKNLNNINELYEHFINMYTNNDDPELEELKAGENLIDNLKKLQQVILSIENNASYIARFNYLITIASGNKELEYHHYLKTKLTDLKINETPAGKGEVSGKNDIKMIECFNLIKSKLKSINGSDTLKTTSYNELIQKINKFINNTHIDWYTYVKDIKPLFDKNIKDDEIINWINAWINTCIIPDNIKTY